MTGVQTCALPISDENADSVWINQDAVFSLAHAEKDSVLIYKNKFRGNGVYLFIIEGDAAIKGETLHKRDVRPFRYGRG